MPWRCALDLVTSVRCLRGRLLGELEREAVDALDAAAREDRRLGGESPPAAPCARGRPTPEYSPSVFSRITTQSIWSALASTLFTPGSTRAGRTLAYWSKPWQIGRRRPQSDTWSGTSGAPTAPKKIASKVFSSSSPPSGM